MTVNDHLLAIVGDIYACVGEPSRWRACLSRIADLLDATGVNLIHFDHREQRGGITVSARSDPAAAVAYATYYHAIDPWASSVAPGDFSAGQVLMGQRYVPHAVLKRTEFYAGLGRPYGLSRCLAGVIEAPGGHLSSNITINRADRDPEFDAHAARLLGALLPHLRRALALHQRLAGIDVGRGAIAAVLDRLRAAVILVNADRRVVFVNRAARHVLDMRDGLTIDRGTVRATDPGASSAITSALAGAAGVASGIAIEVGRFSLRVPRPSGRRPFQVVVTPLPQNEPGARDLPAAALWVNDPEAMPQAPEDLLREAYRLTATEARVAARLANGRNVSEIAADMRITTGTARWYVKQVLAKTGTSSQAQLVRLLLTPSS